ncbi:hypothetical protein NKH77_46990 [Streptomyces sp. M19]
MRADILRRTTLVCDQPDVTLLGRRPSPSSAPGSPRPRQRPPRPRLRLPRTAPGPGPRGALRRPVRGLARHPGGGVPPPGGAGRTAP